MNAQKDAQNTVNTPKDALNVTLMYQFNNSVSTLYFSFACADWLALHRHCPKARAPVQLVARLVARVPQAHCDLERSGAYYAVSLELTNLRTAHLQRLRVEARSLPGRVIALTRRLEVPALAPRQSQALYLEYYSYLEARLLPGLVVSVGADAFEFRGVLLLQ